MPDTEKLLKIIKASRYFKVIPTTDETKKLCRTFQMRFIHKSKGEDGHIAVYASALADESEFRFHINVFNQFMSFIKDFVKKDEYTVETKTLPVCDKRTIKIKEQWKVRDYQEPIVNYLTADTPIDKFVGIQTGKGKATSLKELIKTPTGWTKMGDIKVGDDVIAKDGSTTKVTGVFPQGKVQLHRVTFTDGRYIDCCKDHLWKVYYYENDVEITHVVNTVEILRLLWIKKSGIYIDLCDPQDCKDIELPNDPYELGVSLAKKYNVTNKYIYSVPLSTVNLTLDKDIDNDVSIPDIYFNASKSQRLQLLQGLMDTSGYIQNNNSLSQISFSTISPKLVKYAQYLVRSLGGFGVINGISTITDGKERKYEDVYTLYIKYKHPRSLFKSIEKKDETIKISQSFNDLKLRIESINYVGEDKAQCISIDHPDHLYVTTDFIVTHNTFCALNAVAKHGLRTIIIVDANLLNKWALDIINILDIKPKRTLSVKGAKQLKGLISMANTKEYKNIDIILLSNRTLQDWITYYETIVTKEIDDIGYGINPDELYEHLGIGHRIIDEVHKKFHFNFKQDLYTNTLVTTALSATLFSYDKILEGFYEVAYPKVDRYNGGELDRYAKSYAVMYRLQHGRKVRTFEYGRSEYSHTAVETSILKSTDFAQNYFEMIAQTLELGYIRNYKPGNKAAVYVATTNMATLLVKYLSKRFKDKSVLRYTGSLKDPYSNLLEPDIRVTTLGSGGTGHDIPGLTDTILTIAIMSLQANIQVFGRLRFIPDQDTRFYYFNCYNIEQHMKYHALKEKIMRYRAKSFDILNYYNLI